MQLRIEGTTALCLSYADPGYSALEIIKNIAASGPRPVRVRPSRLPDTIDPSDPHQCMERMENVDPPPADCIAMGF